MVSTAEYDAAFLKNLYLIKGYGPWRDGGL